MLIFISLGRGSRDADATLRSALSTAVRWKLIETNPFKGQSTCKIPEADAPFITSAQLKTIQGAIPHGDVRDIVAIAFNTGMRQGEIVSLKWMGVDLGSEVIFVRNDANFKTKTGKQRAIPMNAEVSAILARRKEGRTAGSDSVFPCITNDFVSKQFKKGARSVLGIDTSVHFHSLRHSFCSNLVQAGASIRVVQSLAGHASCPLKQLSPHGRRSVSIPTVSQRTSSIPSHPTTDSSRTHGRANAYTQRNSASHHTNSPVPEIRIP